MYPRNPWEMVADPKGSAEHNLGTNGLKKEKKVHQYVKLKFI